NRPAWPLARPSGSASYTKQPAPSSRIVATPLGTPIPITPPSQSAATGSGYERAGAPVATGAKRRSIFDAPESLPSRSVDEPNDDEDEFSISPGRPASAYPRATPVPL